MENMSGSAANNGGQRNDDDDDRSTNSPPYCFARFSFGENDISDGSLLASCINGNENDSSDGSELKVYFDDNGDTSSHSTSESIPKFFRSSSSLLRNEDAGTDDQQKEEKMESSTVCEQTDSSSTDVSAKAPTTDSKLSRTHNKPSNTQWNTTTNWQSEGFVSSARRSEANSPKLTGRERKVRFDLDRLVQSAKIVSVPQYGDTMSDSSKNTSLSSRSSSSSQYAASERSNRSNRAGARATYAKASRKSSPKPSSKPSPTSAPKSKKGKSHRPRHHGRARRGVLNIVDPVYAATPRTDAREASGRSSTPQRKISRISSFQRTLSTSFGSREDHPTRRNPTVTRDEETRNKSWIGIPFLLTAFCMVATLVGTMMGVLLWQNSMDDDNDFDSSIASPSPPSDGGGLFSTSSTRSPLPNMADLDHPTYSPTFKPTQPSHTFHLRPRTPSPTQASSLRATASPAFPPSHNHEGSSPANKPSFRPTDHPSLRKPTTSPTKNPSLKPTITPPSSSPTALPTVSPTALPTFSPTTLPTVSPTVLPTVSPTVLQISTDTTPPLSPNFSTIQYTRAGNVITGISPSDHAGRSVSLSADGSLFAVGATGASRTFPNSSQNSTAQPGAGMVRVYSRQMTGGNVDSSSPIDPESVQWIPMGDPLWGSGASAAFGFTTCLSKNGMILAVSEPGFDLPDGTLNVGAVRVFQYDEVFKSWVTHGNQDNQNLIGEASGDLFGYSIALSGDGMQMAVGSPWYDSPEGGYNSGGVRLLEYDNKREDWIILGDPLHGLSSGDGFGKSCSMSYDGSIVAVGAPESEGGGYVQIFTLNGKKIQKWDEIGIIYNEASDYSRDAFGKSISLSSDGNQIAIGAPGHLDQAGFVAVYKLSLSMHWGRQGEAIAGGTAQSSLGSYVSLSSDGSILVIGGSGDAENGIDSGQVLVLQWDGDHWVGTSSQILGGHEKDHFGFAVTTSEKGSWVGVGAPVMGGHFDDSRGYAHVYVSSKCIDHSFC